MKIIQTKLPGVVIIEPRVFRDDRGFFVESFHGPRFAAHGLPADFPQDNRSRSIRGVLRGLHYQLRHPQGKLISVISGSVYDVVADIRVGSPTFGQWIAETLHADEPRFIWAPPGVAHGFCVLSDVADVVYKCTAVYDAADDRGVAWSDPRLNIDWPVREPLVSERDRAHAPLDERRSDLPTFQP